MLRRQIYGFRHDVWSLGVLTYFLFAGRFPFEADNDIQVREQILKTEPNWELLAQRKVPGSVVRLIKKLLIKNSLDRPTARKLIKSDVFDIVRANESKVDAA